MTKIKAPRPHLRPHLLPHPGRRWLTWFLPVSFLLGISQACAQAAPTPPRRVTITIHPDQKRQVWEGFGASGAWWAQDIGGWEEEKRQRIISLLFDRQAGIGLSVYRYAIGAGEISQGIRDPWRKAETYEVSPGEYDWSRDANARWVLRAARDAGVETFVAFANSPPGRMTVSGFTSGESQGGSNLRPEMAADFAGYLVDVVTHLREVEGIPIAYISPLNEPQWDWNLAKGQEGCHYEPEEVAAVTKALLRAIKTRGMAVKVSVFESGEWKMKSNRRYIAALLSDPEIAGKLDHLAVHSYWSSDSHRTGLARFLKRGYPDTKLWMTEWTEMQGGRDAGMESALALANTIHADLTNGGVASWQYWIAVSAYDYHDGLVYVDLATRRITETRRLWALGNYSRFIRPGFVRVEVESPKTGPRVSAFQSPDGQSLVAVAINNSAAPVLAALNLPGGYRHLTISETSPEHGLAAVFAGPPGDTLTLAPLSVTTLLFER